jgi:hypothetical protein
VRRIKVPPEIAQMIGECGLTRNGTVRILAGLHGELPQGYTRYRGLRHPDDDRLFFFFDALADGDRMHTFTFHVDDSTSAEHLIVKDLEHESRPLRA